MLIVFGGLPGTGKTTISRLAARRRSATYVRIDTIEQAIRAAGGLDGPVGTAGYAVAMALAETHLADGLTVVADCVNPVSASRQGWRQVAAHAGAPLIEVEIVCTNAATHRHRVETRAADMPGLTLPSWDQILSADYEPWLEPHLVIDSAALAPDAAVDRLEQVIAELPLRPAARPDKPAPSRR